MSDPELLREVARWLRFASEDLHAAETLSREKEFIPRHVCWLAQQAAEKALKGALVSQRIEFPFRHDLDVLRNLLPDGWEVRRKHPDLAELTEWAIEARYPGDWPDPTAEDAQKACLEAQAVYECVITDLQRHGIHIDHPQSDQ
ncbi:MAG: HEPN domain-containing protein [Acidobacteria bacterium]|nr:HEPN domain-containing protein [Acidobacteriota bacterium]